jgi:cysteine synthase
MKSTPCQRGSCAGQAPGGTSATIGRYIRYQRQDTRLCVADPLNSIFHRHFVDRSEQTLAADCASFIEGIGRPRVEPSFVPSVVDRMIAVDDAQSIGAMQALGRKLGRRVGGSTGTNLWACMLLAREMQDAGQEGSIVTLLCDGGERYERTYYDEDWLAARGLNCHAAAEHMHTLLT